MIRLRNVILKLACAMTATFVGATLLAVAPTVTSVTAQQRYPWNGLVDITVSIKGEKEAVENAICVFAATNCATGGGIAVAHVTRNGADTGSETSWTRRFIWDTNTDLGEVRFDDVHLTADFAICDDPSGSNGVQLWEGGPYWAECNVGASKPEEIGLYFWWGDTVGRAEDWRYGLNPCPTYEKSHSELRSLGYIDSADNLALVYDAARVHLGTPWRMPTESEVYEIVRKCSARWTTRNGLNGLLVNGRGVYESRSIFLPAAAIVYGDGRIGGRDWDGSFLYVTYWASTPDGDSHTTSVSIDSHVSRNEIDRAGVFRNWLLPVRPVRGPSK